MVPGAEGTATPKNNQPSRVASALADLPAAGHGLAELFALVLGLSFLGVGCLFPEKLEKVVCGAACMPAIVEQARGLAWLRSEIHADLNTRSNKSCNT